MPTENLTNFQEKSAKIEISLYAVLKIAQELRAPELKPILDVLSGGAILSEIDVKQLTLGLDYMLRYCYHIGKTEERKRCAELLLVGDIFQAVPDKEWFVNGEDEEQRIRVFASAAIEQGL
jgi:hypothetical protein